MSEMQPNNTDFILYTTQDGVVRVDVFVYEDTVLLNHKSMQKILVMFLGR